MGMRPVRIFIPAAVILSLSATLAFSDAYTNLQNSLNAQQPVINLPSTPINWGASLGITYNATLNNTAGGPVTFNGNGSNNILFEVINNTNSSPIIWNGDYIFTNAVINPQIGIPGSALAIFSNTPMTTNVLFNGNITFQDNGVISPNNNEAIAGALVNFNAGVLTFNAQVTFTNNYINGPVTQSGGIGGAVANANQAALTFNQKVTFTNNSINDVGNQTQGIGGALTNFNQSQLTFNEQATFTNNSVNSSSGNQTQALGGAFGNLNQSQSTFNGQVIFTNNSVEDPTQAIGGGVLNLDQSQLTFNQHVQFINNSAVSQNTAIAGAIVNAQMSTLTFNQSSLFSGNTVISQNGPALGGAVGMAVGFSTSSFNAPAIFTANTATSNALIDGGITTYAYGGAIGVLTEGILSF